MSTSKGQERKALSEKLYMVQTLIEKCFVQYMHPLEIVTTLFHDNQIDPSATKLVLERLQNLNPGFFKEYNRRLSVKVQILRLNRQLEQHAEATRNMSTNRTVPTPWDGGLQTHSMNDYSGYFNQTPIAPPSIPPGNLQHTFSSIPSVYANGASSSRQASMLNPVGMQDHTGTVGIMGQTSQNEVVPSALANGSLTYAMNNYSVYQQQMPFVASGNMQHMVNSIPNGYAFGASSSQQAHMQNAVGMQGLMGQTSQNGVVPSTVTNGLLTHSMYDYQPYQHQTPMIPFVASENMQHTINPTPTVYANNASWQQESIQDGVGMQFQTGTVDLHTNMLLPQGSNGGIMNGFNGVGSSVMFGADNGLVEPYNGIGQASNPPYGGGESESLAFKEVMLAMESPNRDFTLPEDLPAGFSCTDILNDCYVPPPVESDEDMIAAQNYEQYQGSLADWFGC